MRKSIFIITLAVALASAMAAEKKNGDKDTNKDSTFIRKAANGGMAEVELGKVAEKNGQREDVKSFGGQMVKDHGKANDNLKAVAAKLNADMPAKINPKHQTTIDKLSKMSGTSFDAAYIKEMVSDHEKDISEFEKARQEVTSTDLQKFIDDTVPVMKEHLAMAKKMQAAK